LFSNLVAALFTNERIRTTDAKAKETRRLAERTITWARRVGEVLGKKPERRTTEESARVVHAVRMARRIVRDRGAVLKLFDELAPRYSSRHGGYTRIVKLVQRPGDAASMSLLELMPEDGTSAPKVAGKTEGKTGSKTGGKSAEKSGSSGGKSAQSKAAGKTTGAAAGHSESGKGSKPLAESGKKTRSPKPKDEK
jgi:large subunit ribosomal protein L17